MNIRVWIRLGVYTLLAGGSLYLYVQPSKEISALNENNYEEKGYIKAKDRYLKYNVYDNGEVKLVADMLSAGCNGDDTCEIGNMFRYVLNLPYKESSGDRDPSAVINQNGGDCDEKAYLFASLLLQRGDECLLIVTREHAFITVRIDTMTKEIDEDPAYVIIGDKKYYYAETSAEGSALGRYNGIGYGQFEAVYDVNRKKEIPLEQVSVHIPAGR